MGSRKKQVAGHRYYFGIHMGVGRGPLDELVEIRVGDRTAWQGSVTANATVSINQPGLFGGDDKEGGIAGTLQVLMGEPTQAQWPALATMLGGLVPAFRGVTTLFFDGLMCSGSPYPKPWSQRWRRALKGWDGDVWYPAKAMIPMTGPGAAPIKAMNPAHILYETFTNRDWGRGFARARLDDASWTAAADKLYAEGFGLCLRWTRTDSLNAFRQTVVDHIGAVIFPDPESGLITLKLIRDDYVVGDLPLFDADSGLLGIDDDDAAAQGASTNEVVVRYRSPIDGKEAQVRVKNAAAIHTLGAVSSASKDYLGLPTAELALRVAQRDLRASAGFLKRFKVRLDRRGYKIVPGAPFRVRDLDRGLATIVLRAGAVEHGPLVDGTVTVTAVQDVFGLPATAFVDVQPSLWVPPTTAPAPVATGRLLEVPYRDLVQQLDAYTLDGLDAGSSFVAAIGAAPGAATLGFELRTRVGTTGPFAAAAEGACCPAAQLSGALGPADTVAALAAIDALGEVGIGSAALIGDEVVRVDAVNAGAGTVTLARGCADTVPATHAAGTLILFYEDTGAAPTQEFSDGTLLQGKLLTRTSTGVLDETAAATLAVTLAARQAKPYPPADLRVAGVRYPATLSGKTLPVAWRHRHRLLQQEQLVDTLAADVGPEPGTTYDLHLRKVSDASVVQAWPFLAGSSMTLLSVPTGSYDLDVVSRRSGVASLQAARHRFDWTQIGQPQIVEVTLAGTFVVGPTFYVDLNGVRFQRTATVGDATLAGVAAVLAASIDASPDYTATVAGAVITITGLNGVVYSVVTGVTAGSAMVATSTIQASTSTLPQISQAVMSGPVVVPSRWSVIATFQRLGTSKLNRRRYSYLGVSGDDASDAAAAVAAAINTGRPDFVPYPTFTRPMFLGDGVLRAVQYDIPQIMWPDRSELDRFRLARSTDGGLTWTDDYVGSVLIAGSVGVRFWDALSGTTRISVSVNYDADILSTTRQIGTAAPTIHDRKPSAGGELAVGALFADGAGFKLIGRPADGSGSATSGMYSYSSTDGVTWALDGALVVDATDPNYVASGAGSFNATYFVDFVASELRKVAGRWFLESSRGLYYTDASNALTGWRRCAVGIDQNGADLGFYATFRMLRVGTAWIITSNNVLGDCVAVSTDNGATWSTQRPAALAFAETVSSAVLLGTTAVLQVGGYASEVLKASSPFTSWTRSAVSGVSSPENSTLFNVDGASILCVDGTGTMSTSVDAITFTPSQFPAAGPAAGSNPDFAAIVGSATVTVTGATAQAFTLSGEATTTTTSTISHRVTQEV